jgi:transcription-repair coupling factor (superfamily II helicase)
VILDAGGVDEARATRAADVAAAFRLRIASAAPRPELPTLPPPEALHLDDDAWAASLPRPRRDRCRWRGGGGAASQPSRPVAIRTLPSCATRKACSPPARAWRVAGGIGRGARRLALAPRRRARRPVADGWPALLALPDGAVALLPDAPDAAGFAVPAAAVVPLIAIRPRRGCRRRARRPSRPLPLPRCRPGDAVIHAGQGLGALRGVEPVTAAEATTDCLRLDYAEGDSLLVPSTTCRSSGATAGRRRASRSTGWTAPLGRSAARRPERAAAGRSDAPARPAAGA